MKNIKLNDFYIALGYIEEESFIYSKMIKSVVSLKANSFTKPNLINILGIDFVNSFPKFNEKGKVCGIDLDLIQSTLRKDCIDNDIFDLENIKGWGIFKDPLSPSDLIINTDKIWGTSKKFAGDRIVNKTVFKNERNLNINKDQATVSQKEVNEFIDVLNTWKFKRNKQDVQLLLGWLATAAFAGVSKWRTHVSVTGSRGTGKSTLQELIKEFLGKFAYLLEGNSTEAGIRQVMGASSGVVLLDESEADGEKLGKILTMLRAASSGIQRAMGTSDQNGKVFELRMCGLLSGIVPPRLNAADESRFFKLELQKLDSKIYHKRMVDTEWQNEVGMKIVKFVIDNYNTMLEVNKYVRKTLIKNGYDSRYCDTYGLLISASFMLTNVDYYTKVVEEELFDEYDFLSDSREDDMASMFDSTDEQRAEYEQYKHLFSTIALNAYIESFDFQQEKKQSETSDENELLNQILITEVKSDKMAKRSILSYIFDYHKGLERSNIKNILGTYGIKTEEEANGEFAIYIDTNDNNLKRLLKETRFGAGDLRAVLLRVQGASELKKEVSIGNIKRSRKELVKVVLDSNIYKEDE